MVAAPPASAAGREAVGDQVSRVHVIEMSSFQIELTPSLAPSIGVLLNLSPQCPDFFARYPRLLEIVSRDEEERKAGRTRYAWYRERGYAIRNHDLAAEGAA